MKKAIMLLVMFIACNNVWSGQIGLPDEQIALPAVQGSHLVCIWDESAGQWLQSHQTYDQSGIYSFKLPAWGRWYWVGLWDQSNGQYVFGKWVGHFLTN